MNRIRGKDTSLTLLKDNTYTPLCYTEETIRQSVVDYALPATIGKQARETRHQTDTKIEGCFVTRLDADSVIPIFDAVSSDGELFTLLCDRVFSKNIFTQLRAKSFIFRAENKNPFYFHIDVESSRNSTVDKFNHLTPVVKWNTNRVEKFERIAETENGSVRDPSTSPLETSLRGRVTVGQKETFFYDGLSLVETAHDREHRLPLIYRFELNGDFSESRKFSLTLYYALSDELYPDLEEIEKIIIPISSKNGMYLELKNLKSTDDRTNIRTSDEVLVRQKFRVRGAIRFVARNKNEFVRIEL